MTKRVVFKNKQGKRLVGLIDQPKGKPPYPAVIICHGFKGYKEQMHLLSLARELAKNGILAFRFDFGNGIGESYGKMADIKFGQYLKDLKAAVDFISRQKIVDKNKFGLAGHSLGGQLVMHYAPSDKRIKVIADLAGVISSKADVRQMQQYQEAKRAGYFIAYSRSKKRSLEIKFEYLKDLLSYDTAEKIKKIRIPTLIVHGTHDVSVPLGHSRLAYKLLKDPKKLAVIKNAPHTWRQPKYYKRINPVVVDWFKKYLSR